MSIYRSEHGGRLVRERYEQQLAAWPVPAQRHTVETSFGRTFALACGDDTAPAVVLLHGSGANSSVWQDGIDLLAAGRRVVLLDLMGEPGLSDPVRLDLTTGDTADWLVECLDALGVGTAAFAGLSLGGWTVADFATRRPERVDRLPWCARPRAERFPVFDDETLRRLTMPVLAVLGGRDRVFDPVGTERRLRSLVRDVRVEVVPTSGHALVGQTPRIVEFLG